ncbi:serine protease [Mesorhizobium sp.]|uniref:S1 family peptidase n=1 Tax=Mesorhizobium sp. TaxID=1871066 RepID=UPI000FE98B9F|nr:serine protease [Mesorhizobium sp.]RWM07981.1 MAG: serine protease [Mesorhizobium sp.]
MRLLFLAVALFADFLLMGNAFAASAALPEETIVYIKCNIPKTQTTPAVEITGSGVVVSPEGYVLTARHVLGGKPGESLPANVDCRGTIGVADSGVAKRLIAQPIEVGTDAALLQFSETKDYPFAKFCKVEDWMIRRDLFVAGFPGDTGSGAASFRKGVLSTVKRNAYGLLETDGQTIEGMSGGPVYASNLNAIIGIVIGASFASDGTVSYFGILPVSFYQQQFGLTASDEPCYYRNNEVELRTPPVWKGSPVKLGIHAGEGFCFLSGVGGQFNSATDYVGVTLGENDEYVLTGVDDDGGVTASARCIRNER